MSDLFLVLESFSSWIGQFLSKFNESWFTQILLFLIVLSGLVNVILIVRGTKK